MTYGHHQEMPFTIPRATLRRHMTPSTLYSRADEPALPGAELGQPWSLNGNNCDTGSRPTFVLRFHINPHAADRIRACDQQRIAGVAFQLRALVKKSPFLKGECSEPGAHNCHKPMSAHDVSSFAPPLQGLPPYPARALPAPRRATELLTHWAVRPQPDAADTAAESLRVKSIYLVDSSGTRLGVVPSR